MWHSINGNNTLNITTNTLLYNSRPNSKLEKENIEYLKSIYKGMNIVTLYSEKNIEYICGLSTRFALWNMPISLLMENNNTSCKNQKTVLNNERKNNAIKSFSLWLSLVWIIDGIFDKGKNLTESDRESIRNAFLGQNDVIYINSNNSLMVALFDCTLQIKKIYNVLIKEYVNVNEKAYIELEKWTNFYMDTLLVKNDGIKSLNEYRQLRLKGGGMMCVVWHLMLFICNNRQTMKIYKNNTAKKIFETTALIVSYHNDLLSVGRDLEQHVPNVCNYFDNILSTINHINSLYLKINLLIDNIKENKDIINKIHQVSISILDGSYNWANNESRYKDGVDMLNGIKNNNAWIETPGDPTF